MDKENAKENALSKHLARKPVPPVPVRVPETRPVADLAVIVFESASAAPMNHMNDAARADYIKKNSRASCLIDLITPDF